MSGYRDDAQQFAEATQTAETIAQYAASATPEDGDTLGRAYVMNRNLNPEALTALVLGGGDESVVAEANRQATSQMLSRGVDPLADLRLADGTLDPRVQQGYEQILANGGFVRDKDTWYKKASRGVFTVLDTPVQAAQNVAGMVRPEGKFWDMMRTDGVFSAVGDASVEVWGGTTGGQWVAGALDVDLPLLPNMGAPTTDMGRGFFPAGELGERQSVNARYTRGVVTGKGGKQHAWTVGRGAANQLVEWDVVNAGDRNYDLVSGTLDAAVAIFGDPSNYIPGVGWGDEVVDGIKPIRSARMKQLADVLEQADSAKAAGDDVAALRLERQAKKMLGVSDKVPTGKHRVWRAALADDIGLTTANGASSVSHPALFKWMASGRGRRVIEHVSTMTDAEQIRLLHKGKISAGLASDLAKASDPLATMDVYAKAMSDMSDGQRALGAVPGLGRSFVPELGISVKQRLNAHVRWGNMFPGSTVISPDDDIESLNRLRSMLLSLSTKTKKNGMASGRGGLSGRYDVEQVNRFMNQAIDAFANGGSGDLFNLYNDLAGHFRTTLVAHGWDPDDAAKATQWSDELGRLQQYTHRELATGAPAHLPFFESGVGPISANQLLSGEVHLMDEGALWQAIREQNSMFTLLRTRAAAKGDPRRLKALADAGEDMGGGKLLGAARLPQVMLDHTLGNIWKGVTLFKIGYITKVVPEEMTRVMSSGIFMSPWDMLQAMIGHGRVVRGGRAARKIGHGDALKEMEQTGRYSMDALGHFFDAGHQMDVLVNHQQELLEQAQRAARKGNTARAAELEAAAQQLDDEIQSIVETLDDVEGFYKAAMIGTEPDAALAAITKDKRTHFARGVWAVAQKGTPADSRNWVAGMRQALLNEHADMLSRRIANRGLFDGDNVTIGGVRSTWGEHVAAGRTTVVPSAPDTEDFNRLGATWDNHDAQQRAIAEFDALPDDAYVYVYHGTSPADAASIVSRGSVDPLSTQSSGRLAGQRTAMTPGLYVAPTVRDAKAYGSSVVRLRVRKGDLVPSGEMSNAKSVGEALFNSSAGAVIPNGRVNAELYDDLARQMTADEQIIAWMQDGAGRGYAASYVKAGGMDPSFNWNTPQGWQTLIDVKKADIAYLTGADEAAYTAKTLDGADDELLGMIANGSFRGKRAYIPDAKTRSRVNNADLEDHLSSFREMDNSPISIRYSRSIDVSRNSTSEVGRMWHDALSFFFRELYGQASDKLSRSPSFRRIYWKNVTNLMPGMAADEAAALLARATAAGLPPTMMDDLRTAARLARGKATAEVVDKAAKGFALDSVRDLLFDSTKKGMFFDQMRLIFPFGDAYKEVFTSWGKIMVKRQGRPLKSLGKGVRGAQGATALGPDYNGDGQREGFMWKHPTTGQWVFSVPFSQQLSKLPFVGGAAYPGMELTMDARSLNVLGNVLPGIGPVSDQLVNSYMPDTKEFDTIRSVIFPFGEPIDPEAPNGGNIVQRTFVPAWMRKVAAGPWEEVPGIGGFLSFLANSVSDRENDPSYLAARNNVVKQLASETVNGQPKYPDTPEGMAALARDADDVAQRIYMFRGGVQFFSPAAPMSDYLAETKVGNIHAALLAEELRALENEYLAQGLSTGEAASALLDKYGPGVWLYTTANTTAKFPGIEATNEWWDWWRDNKDATDKFGMIGGFFGPAGGAFSIDVYGSQMSQGLRYQREPTDMIRSAREDLMLTAYNRFRDELDADGVRTDAEVVELRDYRAGLEEQYGISFDGVWADKAKKSDEQLLDLLRMVNNYSTDETARRLLDTPTGDLVLTYLSARSEVEAIAAERGVVNWQQTADEVDLRTALRGFGRQLATQDASFAKMWDYLLEGEMKNDDDVPTPTVAGGSSPATSLPANPTQADIDLMLATGGS